MAIKFKFKSKHRNGAVLTNGSKDIVVLHPGGKGRKYATELKNNTRITNEGVVKKDKPLTKEGKAWRSGYLQARKDSAKAWKAKNKK